MFRKIILTGALLLAYAAGASAQGQRYVADKVVAVVGNSAITYSELMEESRTVLEHRRQQGYTSDRDPVNEALEGLMVRKLLYNQALVDSVEINHEYVASMVESEFASLEKKAGSVAQLEADMGEPSYQIRKNLQNKYEELAYAQAMQDDVTSKVKITPGEVEMFYEKLNRDSLPIIPEQYVYAQIVRYPVSTTEEKQRVREQLLEMRERIINGTRFDLLARMYSVDPGSAMKGGELDWMPLNSFYQPFSEALEKLQPGQISEVVETEAGYHIIELIDKDGDLYKCRHILLRPVYTPQELAKDGRFLDSLAQEIRSGKITFEKAAEEYSDDKYSRHNGGIVTNHEMLEYYNAGNTQYSTTKFMREDLRYDYPTLSTLKEGEISSSFRSADLRGNELNKIVKLVRIIPTHPANLQEDYPQIEQLALEAKKSEVFERWLDQKIDGLFVRIEPEFRNGDFYNKNWVK